MSRMSPGFASAHSLAQCDLPIATPRYECITALATAPVRAAPQLWTIFVAEKNRNANCFRLPQAGGQQGADGRRQAAVLCGGWGNGKLHVVCCHVLCRRWLYKSVQKLPAKSAAAIRESRVAARRPTTTRRDASGAAPGQLCGADLMPSACLDATGCKMRQHVIIVRCERRFMCAVCKCATELTWNQNNSKIPSCFFFTLHYRHCTIDILSYR